MRCTDCGNKMRQLPFPMSNPWHCDACERGGEGIADSAPSLWSCVGPRQKGLSTYAYAWGSPGEVPLNPGWSLVRLTSNVRIVSRIGDARMAYPGTLFVQSITDGWIEFEYADDPRAT